MNDSQLDDLIRWCDASFAQRRVIAPIPEKMVREICESQRISIGAFCDAVARRVAHEYHARHLSFQAADAAINALHVYVANTHNVELPSYSREVFCAFDEGEYLHAGEAEDPD
jgi:hypothetical protein